MTTFSVIVATFGDRAVWDPLAQRAATSATSERQGARQVTIQDGNGGWALEFDWEVRHVHAETLHEARNTGAAEATGDWLIFLDADDELAPGYIGAMAAAENSLDYDELWVMQPATLGVHPDGHEDDEPVVIPPRPLITGNYLVIGTAVPRLLFHKVGGFRDLPHGEDWDFHIRLRLAGALSIPVPDAVYRVGVNPDGRNAGTTENLRTLRAIRHEHEQAWLAAGLSMVSP